MTNLHSGLTQDELGTVEAVLLEFNRHQMPRLLDIKQQVERGEVLDEFEIIFLQETLQEIRRCENFADKHVEFQMLMAEVAALYHHITQRAAKNELGNSDSIAH